MLFNRDTLRELLLELLKDELKIEVEDGGFTDPNRRHITVLIDEEKVAEFSFDVVQRREYEG